MPAPIVVAATGWLRSTAGRRLVRIGLIAIPFAVIAAVSVGTLLLLTILSGNDSNDNANGGACSTVNAQSPTTIAQLTSEQVGNAQTIVAVGRELNVPPYGWVIAVATAMQESGLRNLSGGDSDSIGLFQQRGGWGSAGERHDPAAAARMFYSGGQAGQPGLLSIKGFQTLELTVAAQEVQQSAFPTAYAKWEGLAQNVVGNPTVLSATCYTSASFLGDGTEGARSVQAALQWLGTPYSWGGGGPSGPTRGFGPGASTVGFDCSSLMQYAWKAAAGVSLPRVADAQAAAVPHVPPGQPLQAGDLLFFHSPSDPAGVYHHVGMYDGQGNMVHAPSTGKTVEVVHDVLSNPYFSSQLAVVGRPGGTLVGALGAHK